MQESKKKIAYILSVFPGYTETFISNEILEVQKKLEVHIFSLKNFAQEVIHKDCVDLKKKTFYSPYLFSLNLVKAQIYFIYKRPYKYFYTLIRVIFKNMGDPIMLLKILVVYPKIIYFAKEMQSLGIQHIHAHWASISSTAAYIAAKMLDLPFSFTAHAYDIYVGPSMMQTKLQSSKYVVTISEYNKKWILNTYGNQYRDKVHVIHCGIDTRKFFPSGQKTSGEFTIFSIGRLIEKKGIECLIKACYILKKKNLIFRCVIAGEGPEKKNLKKLIKEYELHSKIKLIGIISQEKVIEQLYRSHVFVLPCKLGSKKDMDGIPVCLMEAMAMQLPAISTDISGIPELIENNISGLLVSPGNELEIANAIITLMDNSNMLINLGLQARKKIVKDFNVVNTSNQLVKLLKG